MPGEVGQAGANVVDAGVRDDVTASKPTPKSTDRRTPTPGDPTVTTAKPKWLPTAPPGAPRTAEQQTRDKIELWLSKNPKPSAQDIVAELEALKPLSQENQIYLISRTFPASSALATSEDLAKALQNKPDIRNVFTKWLLSRAAELESKSTPKNRDTSGSPHSQAGLFTLAALKVMQGHDEELGALIAQMSPKDGEFLASTLGAQNPLYIKSDILVEAHHQLLSALNSVPRTDTTGAMVQTLYLQIHPEDIKNCSALAASLAKALGREFNPQPHLGRTAAAEKDRLQAFLQNPDGAALMLGGSDKRKQRVLGALQKYPAVFTVKTFEHHQGPWVLEPKLANVLAEGLFPSDAPNRKALVAQVGEILATPQGQQLWFEGMYGFDPKVAPAAKLEAMQAIIDNRITAKDLQRTQDVWKNPVLLKAIVARRMDIVAKSLTLVGINIDKPIKFTNREDLIVFVALTSGLPPDHPKVKPIVDKLFPPGAREATVSFEPVFVSNRSFGVVQFPLYCKHVLYNFGGEDRFGRANAVPDQTFVDDTGREYKANLANSAFAEWRGTNKLPSGVAVSLHGGHISRDGALTLEVTETPEAGRGVEKVVAATMLVGGIFAGGLILVGAGSWIVAGIGFASSLHGAGTALAELDDRRTHGESNAWSDPQARALKLNLAASVAGLGMFASGPALQNTLYYGRLTHEAALGHSLVNAFGAGTDAAAAVNGAVELIRSYKKMSGDDIGLALLQLGWQGLMSGVGMRQAGGFGATFNPMVGARMLIAQHLPPPRIHYGSTEVAGNAVAIRLVDGHHYEIFAGPQATQARIDHHIAVVRQLEGDMTFTDMLARWVGARSGTESGAIAADIRKLNSWIAQQTLKLESSPPGERDAIHNDIAVCEQRRDQLEKRLQALRNNPGDDRGGQPILLPDSTRGSGVRFIRTPSHDLVDEFRRIDRHEFDRAKRETGANDLNDPERIIDWLVKNKKFGKRSLLDRTLGTPDYEQVWQQFLNARAATMRTDTLHARTLSPETQLAIALAEIDPKAVARATKEVKTEAVVIDWFVKNGLGTKKAYEQVWQKYLSRVAKERQKQPEFVPVERPAVAPIPYQPGVIAPPAVAPTPHEPDGWAPRNTSVHDESQTLSGGAQTLPGAPPTIRLDVRGHVDVVLTPTKTNNLVEHLFASMGDRNSPQARQFIDALRGRIERNGNQSLTVGEFLGLVRYYAKGVFDRTTADRIANTMAELSTNDPNVVSSERLRDDYQLNTADLLGALR
jgi:uncharacterized protein DUF4781